jgi:hypothetical protein
MEGVPGPREAQRVRRRCDGIAAPASEPDRAAVCHARWEPRRSMRSERDTRRRGRDASEPARLLCGAIGTGEA